MGCKLYVRLRHDGAATQRGLDSVRIPSLPLSISVISRELLRLVASPSGATSGPSRLLWTTSGIFFKPCHSRAPQSSWLCGTRPGCTRRTAPACPHATSHDANYRVYSWTMGGRSLKTVSSEVSSLASCWRISGSTTTPF